MRWFTNVASGSSHDERVNWTVATVLHQVFGLDLPTRA